jgi:TPR repeat protein
MRASIFLRLLLPAAIALCAPDTRAQAMGLSGTCPRATSADACYQKGLELANEALSPPVDEPGVRKALEVLLGACERDVGDACYVAGRIAAADTAGLGGTAPGDTAAQRVARAARDSVYGRAAVLFAHGCYATDRASAAACNALGFTSSYAPEATRPDSALDHLERGCKLGNPTACVRASLLMDDWPAGMGPASTRPAELAERACTAGSPGGCMELARRTSARLAQAPRRATRAFRAEGQTVRAHLRDACAHGLPPACTQLGATFLPGDPVFSAHADSAAFYLEMACSGAGGLWGNKPPRLGDGVACGYRGEMLLAGEPDPAAVAGALDWFRRGCELVESESCAELAHIGTHYQQIALPLAQLRAVTACNEDSGYGCWVAGWLYGHEGVGDTVRVRQYFQRACALDYGFGCADLGLLLAEQGATADAFKYLRHACALRDGAGCRMYGDQLSWMGTPERTPIFMVRGCALGDAEACWRAMEQARESQDPVREGEYRSRACRLNRTYCKRPD